MSLPVNTDGWFEIVDDAGTRHGIGQMVDGNISFWYGAEPGIGSMVAMPEPEFESTWQYLPQARFLTLWAAP